MRVPQDSSQSQKWKGEDADIPTSDSSNKTSRTGTTTVYDKAFEQNLIDHGICPHGYESEESDDNEEHQYAKNRDQINERLSQPRRSLSRSLRESFRKFERANTRACTEDDVKATVLPTIFGDAKIPCSRNVDFNNMAPLTNGTIPMATPDFYEGSRPADLKKHIRDKLGEYIVPTTDASHPCLPNFFVAVKGPDGSGKALKRQACYTGAMGARAVYKLQSYIDDTTAFDCNAYTLCWTYDSSSGTLIAFATHPTVSQDPERAVDYRMTQLNGWHMTSNQDTYRQGVSAFRNARDWAQEIRRELTDAANKKIVPEPPDQPSTLELSNLTRS